MLRRGLGLFDLLVAARAEVKCLGIIWDEVAECQKMKGGKCILPDEGSKSFLYS